MLPRIPKNWPAPAYTNDSWTDVVAEPCILTTLLIANDGADADVRLRVVDAAAWQFTVMPSRTIVTGDGGIVDARSIVLTGTQRLQMMASEQGVSVSASGSVEDDS